MPAAAAVALGALVFHAPVGMRSEAAAGFVEILSAAGVVIQYARRPIWTVTRPVVVSGGGATIGLHPADGTTLRASYLLDYGLNAAIPRQAMGIGRSV